MKQHRFRPWLFFFAILLMMGAFPAYAGAYSYGNANTETVAESFKLIASKLNGNAPDWAAAEASYAEVRAEIDSHFGKDVAKKLDEAFAARDKERVLKDWKAVLVMNLDRRFQYAEQSFDKYSDAKLLLAKARATYETLKPYLSGTPAEGKEADLDRAFDQALEALGNPGLLGVGKKDPDPQMFKQNITTIYDTIAPLFPMEEGVGGNPGGASDPTAAPAPHAPMQQAKKTNPVVTVAAIAAVLAAGGLLWWRLKRRKA